jgi:hypothetical protein
MRSNFAIANSLTPRLHSRGERLCMPANRLDSKATID